MILHKLRAGAFKLAVCFISMSSFSYAQSETDNIESRTSSTMPVVTKGYYSIYKNAEKLKSSAGKLTFSNKASGFDASDRNISIALKKGYLSIGSNAQKKRAQMTEEGINFSDKSSTGVIQSNTFPVIKKGYFSIGNNAQKLHK